MLNLLELARMGPQQRIAVLERLAAHLKHASIEAEATGDDTMRKRLDGLALKVNDCSARAEPADVESYVRLVRAGVRLLATFHLKV